MCVPWDWSSICPRVSICSTRSFEFHWLMPSRMALFPSITSAGTHTNTQSTHLKNETKLQVLYLLGVVSFKFGQTEEEHSLPVPSAHTDQYVASKQQKQNATWQMTMTGQITRRGSHVVYYIWLVTAGNNSDGYCTANATLALGRDDAYADWGSLYCRTLHIFLSVSSISSNKINKSHSNILSCESVTFF